VSDERPNVLFVDDEPRILDGLRRQLRPRRESWELRFAPGGEAALAMMAERPADILVSDMRMPGMTGGQLLGRVRAQYPQATRIILSGQTDQADLLRDVGCIHQYLQKPCDPDTLCAAVERTAAVAARLRHPAARLAAGRVTALPPRSDTYRALLAELGREDACVTRVGRLVAGDPALTAKLLQLVNSAFFGVPRKSSDPTEAVVLLGLKTIHGIVVAGKLFEFTAAGAPEPAAVARLWDASVRTGDSAARLARAGGAGPAVQQAARLAGMLALIGRAIFMTSDADGYARAVAAAARDGGLDAAEVARFGASQDDVAAYALGVWAFPDEIVEAVAYQRRPSAVPGGRAHDVTAYLHLARSAAGPETGGTGPLGTAVEPDAAFIAGRGLGGLVPPQRRIAV
jgi:HD-like signal output (HDOD) protein/ActR/RegA family two-component response regulator